MFNATWFHEQAPDRQREILNGPAMRPPPGGMSHFERPPDKTALAVSIIISAVSLNALLLTLRVTARVRFQRKVDIEDGLLGSHKRVDNRVLILSGLALVALVSIASEPPALSPDGDERHF